MAKKVKAVVKLQIVAGKATPAPPVGPALGQHGVNTMAFCKEYNEKTAGQAGMVVPVEITVFEDRSFTFIIKTPPAVDLIKKALNIQKGGATPLRASAGKITKAQVRDIANMKLKDLNAYEVDSAMKIIEGTCRSMGIDVVA